MQKSQEKLNRRFPIRMYILHRSDLQSRDRFEHHVVLVNSIAELKNRFQVELEMGIIPRKISSQLNCAFSVSPE